MGSFFSFSLFLKLSSLTFLLIKLKCKSSLSNSEGSLSPSSESGSEASSLPVEHGLSEEPSPLVFFIDNIIPFVESSSSLFVVHSDNEVTHYSVSLLLHFRNKMLLLALILLNLDSEFSYGIFMPSLSSV